MTTQSNGLPAPELKEAESGVVYLDKIKGDAHGIVPRYSGPSAGDYLTKPSARPKYCSDLYAAIASRFLLAMNDNGVVSPADQPNPTPDSPQAQLA